MDDFFGFDVEERRVADTSVEALSYVDELKLEELCIRALTAAPDGLTPDEIAQRTNKKAGSIRPRVTFMLRKRMAVETGERRRNDSGRMANVVKLLPREYWGDDSHMTNAERAREMGTLLETALNIITHIEPTDETRRWVAEVEDYRRRSSNA